jgi:exopolysaccharide biosynthesis polyprenyl glycosylphosphotransferase
MPKDKRVLILGTGTLARKIAAEVEAAPERGYSVLGFVSDTVETTEPRPGDPPLLPATPLGQMHFVEEIMEELRPDIIVVALTERRGRLPIWGLLSSSLAGMRVVDGVEFYEGLTRKLAIESLNPSLLLFSRVFDRDRGQSWLRRLLSVSISAVGIVLSAPFLALAAALVKLDSPGPVFFVQKRVGLGGRLFRLIKLRTMHVAPPSPAGSVWERSEAARVTRVGAWLRRLRVDELPQFINILRGDMDLVGPRPEMAENVPTMIEHIPYYPLRHVVRPGVTGWAQINYGYAVTREQVAEKMRYDLYYVKHASLRLDLKILIGTVGVLLFGRGGHCPATASETAVAPLPAVPPVSSWRARVDLPRPVLVESSALRYGSAGPRAAAGGNA